MLGRALPYKLFAVPKFKRIKKKLPSPLRTELDRQVRIICSNPRVGEAKTGDLQGVRVHKFNFLGQLYLLAYCVVESEGAIYFLAVGGHENFYRDLKKYFKS